jgi:hypothetical protein
MRTNRHSLVLGHFRAGKGYWYQTISLPGSKMPKHQTVSIGSHSSPTLLFILWLDNYQHILSSHNINNKVGLE